MPRQVTFSGERTTNSTLDRDPQTPKNETRRSLRSSGRQHVPTPKMSTRKKTLFSAAAAASSEDFQMSSGSNQRQEDSDLGPMSPLRFSNSPKRAPMKAMNITSFRNILGNASPESDRSLSPDFERRFSHSERYEILSASASNDKENDNSAMQLMDEETRLSFPSGSRSGTPRRITVRTPAENALLDENNSNSLSLLMSSDLNIVEKKREHVLKTPGMGSANDLKKQPTRSFIRKSGGEVETAETPPQKAKSPSSSLPGTSERKARTSLSFSDLRPISTKSFYSSVPEVPKVAAKPSNAPSAYFAMRHGPNKSKSTQKKRGKPQSNSIRLGSFNRGVFHKIKKPQANKKKTAVKKLSTSQILETTSSLLMSDKSFEKSSKKAAKSVPTTPKRSPLAAKQEQQKQQQQLQHQLSRIKKIFQNTKNPIEQARPLSLSRSLGDLSQISQYPESSFGTTEPDTDNEDDGTSTQDHLSEPDVSDADEEVDSTRFDTGSRKFFKSSSAHRIRREYKVINNVSATVRKGGRMSLNQSTKGLKKRKFKSMFEEGKLRVFFYIILCI
ncbi:N-acetyltransferase eco-like [Uranotaenia lowii]|uniref:N-acetyltransferase eco-like n=1 Tax=Uranotaenia lowii TaxID=190385 RepID=UPI002479A744|nr:N-acetyltransferase eco-like [Uranotaenia lowii]